MKPFFKKTRICIAFALLFLLTFIFSSCFGICFHEAGDWIIDKEPDYKSEGSAHISCTVCGETLKTEAIPKLECEHSAFEWIVDKKPSQNENGERHKHCTVCDEDVDTEAIAKITYTENQTKELLADSIVKIYCYSSDGFTATSQGTGFFIDQNGTFITNAHVVRDAYYVKIELFDGTIHKVDLILAYEFETSDYAILRVNNLDTKAVSFSSDVGRGDVVYALGYPKDSKNLTAASGEILRPAVKDGEVKYLESSAALAHGSSGGALVNSDGKVVGITTGQFSNGNFAVVAYRDVKEAITKKYTEGVPPISFFHGND